MSSSVWLWLVIVIVIVIAALQFAGFSLADLVSTRVYQSDESATEEVPDQGGSTIDDHADGEYEPLFTTTGKVRGWRWTFDSHRYCETGVEGNFKSPSATCTFSPSEHPWPSNVPQSLLDTPPAPPPEEL